MSSYWSILFVFLFLILFLSSFLSFWILKKIQTFPTNLNEYENHKQKHQNINLKFIGKEVLEKQTITTRFGKLKLYFWNKKAKNLLIFVHGLISDAYTATKISSTFIDKDYCVLSYDNLGFGESKSLSKMSFGWNESLLLEDVYNWILSNKESLKYKNIILYGESNGGATVFNFMNNNPQLLAIDKVIIDCGYISFWKPLFYRMTKLIGYPLTIFAWITMPLFIFWGKYKPKHRLNKKNAKLITKPVLILQVKNDEWVDPKQINLSKKIAPQFKYYIYSNYLTQHCSSMYDNREEYLKVINDFIEKDENEQ